jgi:hypothetical protein
MPLFRRTPRALPPPSQPLPAGEEQLRAVRATLLQGKQALKGVLYLTDRRLLFEAGKGDARWMVVPFDEMKAVGLYPWPGVPMGIPSSRSQCLVVETRRGEQVWWDFDRADEREWLPLLQARLPAREDDGES